MNNACSISTMHAPYTYTAFVDRILELSAAQVAALFSPADPANKFVITTGDVYAVWMESRGNAIWLQHAGCSPRSVNNVQVPTPSAYAPSILSPMPKPYA